MRIARGSLVQAPAGLLPAALLRVVADFRHAERVASGGVGFGSRGWMRVAEASLKVLGLRRFWASPTATTDMEPAQWKEMVYSAVNHRADEARHNDMLTLSTMHDYVHIKDWGRTSKANATFASEEGRLGFHTPERYLDDRTDLKGTRLKMLCRLNCLPVLERAGREAKPPWPRAQRICCMCDEGMVEDVHHFMMVCPAYAPKRARLLDRVGALVGSGGGGVFAELEDPDKLHILLGKRFGDKVAEDRVDRAVKRFLTKCWNKREPATASLDASLGREGSTGNAINYSGRSSDHSIVL